MITVAAGARPNAVKAAPILRELSKRGIPHEFIWTGQHTGALDICGELGMPEPALRLQLQGLASSEFLDRIAQYLTEAWAPPVKRTAVVVVGDVTSTLAAALAATAHGIPVVHVEAGLRSGDWGMPEERNRAIVDRLSDLCLTTETSARDRLLQEIPLRDGRWVGPAVVFAGNVMIDSLMWALQERTNITTALGIQPGERYAVVTLHRPSNVDGDEALRRSVRAVSAIAKHLPVYWPAHPRVAFDRLYIAEMVSSCKPLHILHPLQYRDMATLISKATLVATDSGGLQEETTALHIPCLTLRENTERPVTIDVGTNIVVGLDPARIDAEVRAILVGNGKRGAIPEGWDGHAAERIVDAIARRYL